MVSDLREHSNAEVKEIAELQASCGSGTIKEDQFQKRAGELSPE